MYASSVRAAPLEGPVAGNTEGAMIKLRRIGIFKPSDPRLERHVTDLIRSRKIVRLRDLVDDLDTDATTIRHELRPCVEDGTIECLCPASQEPETADVELTYYRWVEPTDNDYLWQRNLLTSDVAARDPAQHPDLDPEAYDLGHHRNSNLLSLIAQMIPGHS